MSRSSLLLAARFPKPDMQDLVRRLPERVAAPQIGSAAIESQKNELEPESRSADAPAVSDFAEGPPVGREAPRSPAERGSVKPLSAQRFSVNFTADGEFYELLDEVRALLSHAEPKGDLLAVMKRGLEALCEELLKKRFGVGRKPRHVRLRNSEAQATSRSSKVELAKRTRHVGAAVAREVYVRDGGRCTFCAEDGRRCDERRFLQLDHVVPHAAGGEPTVGNLRLRCRAHNLYTARMLFGREHVRAAAKRDAGLRPKRPQWDLGCSK